MMNKLKVNDLWNFDNLSDNDTIFDVLCDDETYPSVKDFINNGNKENLNIDYLFGFSADKYLSPLANKIYEHSSNDTDEVADKIASIVYNRFGLKWKKIYDALLTEYNPLENYSMEEVRTPDLSFEETQSEKNKSTTERETSANNSYKGFNANEPVLINKTDGSENVVTSGSEEDNEIVKTSEHTGTEELTRAGNIGVTTSQQMLESEFKVRQYDFYKMIYNDIDSVLCLSIY